LIISLVALPAEETCRSALNLAERGLIGQFTGLWPSPKVVDAWVQRNWSPLVKEGIRSHLVGRGFFVFVFDNIEDKNLIFRNGPYFMGPQGLYLNKWSPDFDPTQDVPSAVPVWVCLPHLPLHCWNPKSLESIGNTLGKYIDRAERKDQYSCARICVEVDLEVGLPEAIQLTVADWSHIQELDYEQLPFKCRYCHGYRHFARHCKKKVEEEVENSKGDQWTQVQKAAPPKKNNRSKGKGAPMGTGAPTSGKVLGEGSSAPSRPEASKNPFEILNNPSETPEPMMRNPSSRPFLP
jgi:hypothetical protein